MSQSNAAPGRRMPHNRALGGPLAQSQRSRRCHALSHNGKPCYNLPPFPGQPLCQSHHRESRSSYTEYKKVEKLYEMLAVHGEGSTVAQTKEKLALGQEVLRLRNLVNHRFYSQSDGNRGHVQWILKLDDEVRALQAEAQALEHPAPIEEDHNESPEATGSTVAGNLVETPEGRVFQSLLCPDIPMSALAYLPPDHPALLLKQFSVMFTDQLVAQLYAIVPSLDDSVQAGSNESESGTPEGPHAGELIIRFMFREFLLWKADTEILRRASKMQSIDTFLKRSLPSDLDNYVKVFQSYSRTDTLHFLRDAVCDYLLPSEESTTVILGGAVATNNEQRKMGVEGWDLL